MEQTNRLGKIFVIPWEKVIPRNTELTETLIYFVGIPSVLEFRLFWNSVQSISAEDKEAQNAVLNHFAEKKNT